jgi:hypothetical protein
MVKLALALRVGDQQQKMTLLMVHAFALTVFPIAFRQLIEYDDFFVTGIA